MRLKGETALQEGLWETEPPAGGAGAVCSEQSGAPEARLQAGWSAVSVEAGVAEEATA